MRPASYIQLIIAAIVLWTSMGSGLGVAQAAPNKSKIDDAKELTTQYRQLDRNGDYAAALPLARQACSTLKKELGERAEEVATCLNDLAGLLYEQAAYEQAESLYLRALAIREQLLGPEHPDVANSLNDLAMLHQKQGKYTKAASLYERALTIRKKALGLEHADVAQSLNNLAMLHESQGEYGKAAPLLEQALSLREKLLGPDHPNVAYVLNNLAMVYYRQGKHRKAELLYERAADIFETALGPEHPVVAQSLNNLAMLYYEQGRYEKAELLLERTLAIFKKTIGPEHPNIAVTLTALATLHLNQGRYGEAESLLVATQSIVEKALGPDHILVAHSLNNLGALYRSQGEYNKAEPLFERALSIFEKTSGPIHPDTATNLNNLALIYAAQGKYEQAESALLRALAIRKETLGPMHPHIATSMNNLAMLYYQQERYERAKPLYASALSMFRKTLGPEHPEVAACLHNMAMLYHELGEYGKAASIYEGALSIREKTLGTEHEYVAHSLNGLQRAFLDMGRYDSALYLHSRALRIEEKNLTRAFTVTAETSRLAYAATLFDSTHDTVSFHLQATPNNQRAADLALTTLLHRKGRIQELGTQWNARLRQSLPERYQSILDDLSRAQTHYATLVHRGPEKSPVEDFRARLAILEHEMDKLWVMLRQHSPEAQSLSQQITILKIQSEIPSDSALLEYVSYRAVFDRSSSHGNHEPRYAAYILFPDRFDWVDLGPAAPIDAQIEAFRDAIVRKADADISGHALYDSIMKPVLDRTGLTHRLFIAPDGNLNLVPFDALVDEYDNYLVERFNIHYLTSGRDLLRPWALELPADGPVVVVANPTGADLPGTEHEAALLASLFRDPVTMQRGEATETQLRAHERPRILHLASHGTFGTGRPRHTVLDIEPNEELFRSGTSVFGSLPPTQLDNPMLYTWLDLATPPTPSDDPSTTDPLDLDLDDEDDTTLLDDGRLTAYEVSGWDLRGTELVTLSACDTAQGTYQQGEGILGLRRAFAIAGAQTQIMSLWKVSDTTTAKLMAAYYRRLLAGEGRSEAMRNTQLELLRDPATRHPKDWAAFVVVGEWGPLSGTTREAPPPITRPRGCQASVGAADDVPGWGTPALALLALFARRRPRKHRLKAAWGDTTG